MGDSTNRFIIEADDASVPQALDRLGSKLDQIVGKFGQVGKQAQDSGKEGEGAYERMGAALTAHAAKIATVTTALVLLGQMARDSLAEVDRAVAAGTKAAGQAPTLAFAAGSPAEMAVARKAVDRIRVTSGLEEEPATALYGALRTAGMEKHLDYFALRTPALGRDPAAGIGMLQSLARVTGIDPTALLEQVTGASLMARRPPEMLMGAWQEAMPAGERIGAKPTEVLGATSILAEVFEGKAGGRLTRLERAFGKRGMTGGIEANVRTLLGKNLRTADLDLLLGGRGVGETFEALAARVGEIGTRGAGTLGTDELMATLMSDPNYVAERIRRQQTAALDIQREEEAPTSLSSEDVETRYHLRQRRLPAWARPVGAALRQLETGFGLPIVGPAVEWGVRQATPLNTGVPEALDAAEQLRKAADSVEKIGRPSAKTAMRGGDE